MDMVAAGTFSTSPQHDNYCTMKVYIVARVVSDAECSSKVNALLFAYKQHVCMTCVCTHAPQSYRLLQTATGTTM